MNGFEVSEGQSLKVNVLTDGPTISANYREDKHIGRGGDELSEVYISSSTARTHLMQKLIGDKDIAILRP
jgi:hypothetical protein